MWILSYNPGDEEFFVGLTREEFDIISKSYKMDYEYFKDYETVVKEAEFYLDKKEYTDFIKKAYDIEAMPYTCVVVNRNIEKVTVMVPHFPFGNMWNGYSPWRKIKARDIKSLEEVKECFLDK